MSEDPIGFLAGDANLYRYVGNHPISAVDPTGLGDDWQSLGGWNPWGSNFPVFQRSLIDLATGVSAANDRTRELDREHREQIRMRMICDPSSVDIEAYQKTLRLSQTEAGYVKGAAELGIQYNAAALGGGALRPKCARGDSRLHHARRYNHQGSHQKMTTTTDEILEMLNDDLVSHGLVAQSVKSTETGTLSLEERVSVALTELLGTGEVEIGSVYTKSPEYVEFVAWNGTAEERIIRAMKAVAMADGADKEFAYWLCLRENVDRFEVSDG